MCNVGRERTIGAAAGKLRHLMVLFLLPAALPHLSAAAQVAPGNCSLDLERQASLSSENVPVAPSTEPAVVRFSDGRYAVSHRFMQQPAILVYDSTGDFDRAYEREGSGPGEFEGAPSLHLQPGDTLVAFDSRNSRLTRFDADLNLLETHRSELSLAVAYVAFLPDGRMVRAKEEPVEHGRVASPILRADGSPAHWFAERVSEAQVVVGSGPDGGFMAVDVGGHEVRHHGAEGNVIRRIRLQRNWFDAWTAPDEDEPFFAPPRPRNAAIGIEPNHGALLVVTLVADPEWEPLFEPDEPVRLDFSTLDKSRLYMARVAAFDPDTGELLAEVEHPTYLGRVGGTSDEFHASELVPPLDHVVTRVWRAVLQCTQG